MKHRTHETAMAYGCHKAKQSCVSNGTLLSLSMAIMMQLCKLTVMEHINHEAVMEYESHGLLQS